MILSRETSIFLIISIVVTFFCCKKASISPFQHQEGIYIGTRHNQYYKYIYHYYPIEFDSITAEPTKFEEYYERVEFDTTFIDTARIEIRRDSIVFNTFLAKYNKLPIEEDNIYEISSYFSNGVGLTHLIEGDTFKIYHEFIIDKNSGYSGKGTDEFVGIKQ